MADVDHLEELFAPLGGVSFKRMFSGYGIMKDEVMFALIASDVLYFRADDPAAGRHVAEGAAQWTPTMRGKVMAMPYWQAPERLLDEPDEFADWAREAFAIARQHKAAKSAPKARKTAVKRKPVARTQAAAPKRAKPKRGVKKATAVKAVKRKTRAKERRR